MTYSPSNRLRRRLLVAGGAGLVTGGLGAFSRQRARNARASTCPSSTGTATWSPFPRSAR